jgi:MOSC domain-containing protein YiiM
MNMVHEVQIVGLFTAAGHSYYGHPADAPGHLTMQSHEQVECVAGKGLRGDRFFAWKEDYKGQVTFFAREVLEAACAHVRVENCPPQATRRNVLTLGVDLNELIARDFQIGDVRFRGMEECAPCHWMDQAIGPGAQQYLKGRGGLRAKITRSGILRLGQETLRI